METKTLEAIDETGKKLLDLIDRFTQDQLNVVPFKDSWTAGQVVDHLLLSLGGVVQVVNGTGISTDRDPAEKVPAITAMFLDFTIKMNAPDVILPAPPPHRKAALHRKAEELMDGLGTAGITLDLTEICTAFDLPGFGPLTRLEWIHFSLVHTQRHLHQLENIHRFITGMS